MPQAAAPMPVETTPTPPAAAYAPPEPSYIPGGGLLARPSFSNPRVRLPGTDGQIAHAPDFQMVDPKTQGVAGLIHFIGHLTGAVDPHCMDLDAWQSMTEQERIAHHVSDRQMQAIAEQYHCIDPRAH